MSEYVDIAVATIKTYRVRKASMCGIDPMYMVEYRQFDFDCPQPIKIEQKLYSARPVETASQSESPEKGKTE